MTCFTSIEVERGALARFYARWEKCEIVIVAGSVDKELSVDIRKINRRCERTRWRIFSVHTSGGTTAPTLNTTPAMESPKTRSIAARFYRAYL